MPAKSYPVEVTKVAKYVQQRRKGLYAVLELSQELRAKLGKPRFVKSLQTTDIRKAERLARHLVDDVWKPEIERAKNEPDGAARDRIELMMAKADGDIARIDRIMAGIELEASNIGSATFLFGPDDKPSDAKIAADARHFHEQGQDYYDRATGLRTRLADHIEAWAKQAGYSARITDEAKAVVTSFAAANKELADFTRQKLQTYINNFVNAGRSADTIKKHNSYLRNFWLYLQRQHIAPFEAKPFDGLQRPKRKNGHTKKRLPFTKVDLLKLLKASEGTTLHSLIKLGAYTGCRLEELCSLKLEHVHDRATVPYIHVGDGKNENAIRDVPIHPAILPLVRLLKHNSQQAKDEYLLAGLTIDKYGDRSEQLGREFSELKTTLGYDDRYVFHSIRHTFITELDEAEVFPTTRKWIVGHAVDKGDVAGYLHPRSLSKKAEALAKLSYAV